MGTLKNYYVELMNNKAKKKEIELTKDIYYVDKDYVDYLERNLWNVNCENGRLKQKIIHLKNHQTFEIHELDGNIEHLKLRGGDEE